MQPRRCPGNFEDAGLDLFGSSEERQMACKGLDGDRHVACGRNIGLEAYVTRSIKIVKTLIEGCFENCIELSNLQSLKPDPKSVLLTSVPQVSGRYTQNL